MGTTPAWGLKRPPGAAKLLRQLQALPLERRAALVDALEARLERQMEAVTAQLNRALMAQPATPAGASPPRPREPRRPRPSPKRSLR